MMYRSFLVSFWRLTTVVVLGLGFIDQAQSETVLFNNLSDGIVGNRGFVNKSQYQSFTTGSGPINLTDVKILFVDSVSPGVFALDVLNDNGGPGPGTSSIRHIAGLKDTMLDDHADVFDIPIASVLLAANTRYWIELSSTDPNAPLWSLGTPTANDAGQYTDDTGTIGPDGTSYPFPGPGFNFAFQMEVSGTPAASSVPEPIAVLPCAASLGALMFLRCRRQSR